jgi:hypothetical protein
MDEDNNNMMMRGYNILDKSNNMTDGCHHTKEKHYNMMDEPTT